MAMRLRPLLILALTFVVATSAVRAQSPAAVQNPAEQAAYTKALNVKDPTQRAQARRVQLRFARLPLRARSDTGDSGR